MCETRWTEKYESIKRFNQNFNEIADGLEKLSSEGNQATRNAAYQLHSSITKPSFLIALKLIAKYSALLEPIVCSPIKINGYAQDVQPYQSNIGSSL